MNKLFFKHLISLLLVICICPTFFSYVDAAVLETNSNLLLNQEYVTTISNDTWNYSDTMYKFTLTQSNTITLKLLSSLYGLKISLLNSNNLPMSPYSSSAASGYFVGSESLYYDSYSMIAAGNIIYNLTPGTYYINFTPAANGGGNRIVFSINTSNNIPSQFTEPVYPNAEYAKLNTTYTATLSNDTRINNPADYKFEMNATGSLTLHLKSTLYSTKIIILNANGEPILPVSTYASTGYFVNDSLCFDSNLVFAEADLTYNLTKGTYYLRFTPSANGGDNNIVFSLNYITSPKITKAQGMDGKVALNWTAVDGATNYAVYTYLNGKWSVAGYRTATGMYVTGLTNGTKYGFAVKAYVNGKWSGITSADIVYATPVGAASAKPKITKAAGQNGQVALNWTAVSGATQYGVYYTVGGKRYNAGTATGTGMYVRNLTNGTKYGFAVKAYVNGAWTSISSSDIVYATPVSAAAKPVITKAQGQNGRVALNWTSVSGATNYAVYTYVNGKWSIAGYRTATGMYVTGLTNGTTYGFAVKAYVNGAWTNITSADIVYATPTAAKSDLMDTDFDDFSFLEDNGIDFVDVAPTVR